MRPRLAALLLAAVLGASSAAHAGAPETAAQEAESALAAAHVADEWSIDAAVARRASAAGLGPARARGFLEQILAPCLTKDRCESGLESAPEPARKTAERLLRLLGEMGSSADLPFLARLAARGVYQADLARERVLERAAEAALPSSRCAPPDSAQIAAARAGLLDFVAIRATRAGLVAELPSSAELDDLAYFVAATAEEGPEVGKVEVGVLSRRFVRKGDEKKADPRRDALLAELDREKRAGDLPGVARAARGYLETFGFPATIRGDEEHRYAWGGARYSFAMRDLAEALEGLGRVREAAPLFRRANPGGGMCGTSVEYRREEQTKALIRSEERAGRCRAVVAERLLALDAGSLYGPERLEDAGFDLARLYRGALTTMNRDVPRPELTRAVAAAPIGVRAAALARLEKRGPEDWERRVHAAEGLADAGQRAALRPLLDLLAVAAPPLQRRTIEALGELAARPAHNPCASHSGFGMRGSSSEYHRRVRDLGRACATMLPAAVSDALARRIAPFLADPDPDTREASAAALGRIGSGFGAPALVRLLDDDYAPANVQRCSLGPSGHYDDCAAPHPVREAAEKAVEELGGKERALAPRIAVTARPRGPGRL